MVNFKTFRLMVLLITSILVSPCTHAKSGIEKEKLLYLHDALAGKTLEKGRLATLAATSAIGAAQLWLVHKLITSASNKKNFIETDWLRNKIYEKFRFPQYYDDHRKNKELQMITSAILSVTSTISALYIFPLFYAHSKQVRPTTNFNGLKYPFFLGLNPGWMLYAFCQSKFFDYRHNLIHLLKNYNRDLIPTVFQPTFDKLARVYKEKKTLPLDNDQQHFFVLGILKRIQEELLEDVTYWSFPIDKKIESIIDAIPDNDPAPTEKQ